MRVSYAAISVIILSLLVLMIGFNISYLKGERAFHIVGIAHTHKYKISSDCNVRVKKVFVTSGQLTKKGQPLMLVINKDLETKLKQISTLINLLKNESRDLELALISQRNTLKNQWETDHLQLTASRKVLQAEIALRQSIQPFNDLRDSSSQDPLIIRLHELDKQVMSHEQDLRLRIDNLEAEYQLKKTQLATNFRRLEFDHGLLKLQQDQLIQVAPVDGIVQSVDAMPNEEIPAHQPLLTVSSSHASLITGYIIELRRQRPAVGDLVRITDYGKINTPVVGKIVGFGAVVALPSILQKPNSPSVYGYEVFISIPTTSNLINGEKVLIQ